MSEDIHKELYEGIEDCIPKCCPGCGKEFVRISDGKIWVMPYGNPKGKEKFVVTGFDCYCDNCEWSGNVEPDSLMDIEFIEK
jgi:hypothetical protein